MLQRPHFRGVGIRQILGGVTSHHLVHTHLVAVVGPGAEGEVAPLPVEGEVRDVHHTCALCDGRRVPDDLSIVTQLHISAGCT